MPGISGKNCRKDLNCLVSTFNGNVLQMRRVICEEGDQARRIENSKIDSLSLSKNRNIYSIKREHTGRIYYPTLLPLQVVYSLLPWGERCLLHRVNPVLCVLLKSPVMGWSIIKCMCV